MRARRLKQRTSTHMDDTAETPAKEEQGNSHGNTQIPDQAHPLSAENRAKQRQAFDAANKTHWLFTSTQATNPNWPKHPDHSRTDVHHPTTAETGAMIGALVTFMAYTTYQMYTSDPAGGPVSPWIWTLTITPFAVGIVLALLARRWAKRKDNAEQKPFEIIDAPAPETPQHRRERTNRHTPNTGADHLETRPRLNDNENS